MGGIGWTVVVVVVLLAFFIAQAIHLSVVLKWGDEKTRGLAYYGLPAAERERFKRRLRWHALLLSPILWLSRRTKLDFRKISFRHRDVAGPLGSTSPESFARAEAYRPRPEDVFVVTQMKCGTTWMQHVVYQVLLRGEGDLVTSGRALYAVAPWLEGLKSVSVEDAPLIGTERPSRIIKSHLPAHLCPDDPVARYVYVARHPASCFASSVDFVRTNTGGIQADPETFEAWFRSPELMWWGTWPDHVKGWWERAQRNRNVLFVHFEEMKRNLRAVVAEVARFLGVRPLTDAEIARVVEKCGFEYMQRHQEAFEMFPPHILQTNARLFVRGSADRHEDVPADVRARIVEWARSETAGTGLVWGEGEAQRTAGGR